MTEARLHTGRDGEDLAARHLRTRGFVVLERNARTRYGELDIVARDGHALVFAEVKTLRGPGRRRAEQALESIGPRKRIQVRRLARAWLAERPHPGPYTEIRFDAVGVALSPAGSEIVHVPAAF
jgi:putative endonuclease